MWSRVGLVPPCFVVVDSWPRELSCGVFLFAGLLLRLAHVCGETQANGIR